jgi:hypothetical protein
MLKQYAGIVGCGSAFLLSLASSPVQAADPGFCRNYARAALNQVQLALSTPGCRRGLEGARWSSDFRVHFDWCVGASPIAADGERAVRTEHLRVCRR